MAVKKCVICGKEFTDYGRGKYCQGPHFKTCEVCGKKFEYDCRSQHIPRTCSHKCAGILATTYPKFKSKTCQQCGLEFIPNSGNQKVCDRCKIKLDN